MTQTAIQFLSPVTVLIKHGEHALLFDPSISNVDASTTTPLPSPISAVFFTGARKSRFDPHSLNYIKQENTRVVAPKSLAKYLRRFFNFEVSEANPIQSTSVGTFRITAFAVEDPCWRFFTSHPVSYHYVVESSDHALFFAADAKYDESLLRRIGDKYKISLAVLPHTAEQEKMQHDLKAESLLPPHKEIIL